MKILKNILFVLFITTFITWVGLEVYLISKIDKINTIQGLTLLMGEFTIFLSLVFFKLRHIDFSYIRKEKVSKEKVSKEMKLIKKLNIIENEINDLTPKNGELVSTMTQIHLIKLEKEKENLIKKLVK